MIKLKHNNFLFIYLIKFIGAFCFVYFGTLAVIGLSAPGRYYSSIIDQYFDYISWLRSSLLYGSKVLLAMFGYNTYLANEYLLKLKGGYGVRMVYSCIGYGVMSFWIAFIFANKGRAVKKFLWIAGGLICIWIINVARISLLLVATNKHWPSLFGFDHHTWFNIASYVLVFTLMYFFDRSLKTKNNTSANMKTTMLSTTDN